MTITSDMVKKLREETGLPMMACKQALQEAGGDAEKAQDILRKKGLGQVSKLAGRATEQGRVACFVERANRRAGLAELLCETSPVANTDDFIQLTQQIARHAAALPNPTPDAVLAQPLPDDPRRTVGDRLTDVVNKIRENIKVARVAALTGHVGHYVHHNGQVGVLVEMSADCPDELKADVCMHIAAMRPLCTRREEVDPALVAREQAFAAEQAQGKPANMLEKIVAGKLNRWYGEIVLLEQPFAKDDKKTVGQVLMAAVPGLTVNRFVRFQVGQTH